MERNRFDGSRAISMNASRGTNTLFASAGSVRRYVATVRHLRSRQIIGQIRHRLPKRYGVSSHNAVDFPGVFWPGGLCFLAPGLRGNGREDVRSGLFTFLNHREELGFPPDWACRERPKLWQYNLHYFEWLWSLEYGKAKEVVFDWIGHHLLQKGNVGWEAFPLSLRIVNWCALFFGRFREQVEGDCVFVDRLWGSIHRQAQGLMKRLDIHLLGNHYLENGAALAFVGSCFKGDCAHEWFEKGYGILREQISEQILPDGMHFELSPMYHCRMLYVLTMLMATGNRRLRELIDEPLGRMLKALDVVCHPDGRIALLNDSAFGIYNEPAELRTFAQEESTPVKSSVDAPVGCFSLPDAGYYGWSGRKGDYIICDAGKIGPDYIPGHAHADMFNYELSLDGQRVVVDSGVYDYEVSPMRRYVRSTKAHNTVEIDGHDQCEMWGAFRVARRGYCRDVSFDMLDVGFELNSWHNGYRRLPGKPVHRRFLKWTVSEGLLVRDTVTASKAVSAVSRIHLHPQCQIIDRSDGTLVAVRGDTRFQIVGIQCDCLEIEHGWYCPEFGRRLACNVICLAGQGGKVELSYQLMRC
jgi:uncharacterized heparinase superfamily protein